MLMRTLFLTVCLSCSAAIAQYTAEILPTPTGEGSVSGAGGGQIVGDANSGLGGWPCMWDMEARKFVSLVPKGYDYALVNGAGGGKQVGYGFSGSIRAVMWSGSAGSVVDLHPAGYGGSYANGTDGKTQVGAAGNGFTSHAMLWRGTAASAVSLHPAGYDNSQALDVWGDLQVGGVAGSLGGGAVLWRGTTASMQFLPTPATHTVGDALGVYGNQAVGRIVDFAAVVWDIDKWTYTALGEGFAVDTNGQHQVGERGPAGQSRAIRWTGTEASALDLHSYLPLNILESRATGIDENGAIVGWGTTATGSVPIVWTPVPEPSAWISLAIGLGVLALRERPLKQRHKKAGRY